MAIENALPPIHPGVFLKEILDELGISQNAFAQAIGDSPMRVSHVIKGLVLSLPSWHCFRQGVWPDTELLDEPANQL
jgi:hypothetical protein